MDLLLSLMNTVVSFLGPVSLYMLFVLSPFNGIVYYHSSEAGTVTTKNFHTLIKCFLSNTDFLEYSLEEQLMGSAHVVWETFPEKILHSYVFTQSKWEFITLSSTLATEIHLVEPMRFIGVTYINTRMKLLIEVKRTKRQLHHETPSQHEIQLMYTGHLEHTTYL